MPPIDPIDPQSTIPKLFFEGEEPGPLLTRAAGEISGKDFRDRVASFATGLASLGIEPGERVAILHENAPEWIIADLAISSAGAVTVPIYPTLAEEEAAFILNDSGASALIFSGSQTGKASALKGSVRTLRHLIDTGGQKGGGGRAASGLHSFASLTYKNTDDGLFAKTLSLIAPDDLFSIVYTSGTTGRPKGVELSHRNLLSNISSVLSVVDIRSDDLYLSYLPLSHIFERMIHLLLVLRRASIAYSTGFAYVGADASHFRPTLMAGVPFFFERIKSKVLETLEDGGALKKFMARDLLDGARGKRKKGGLLSKLVAKKVREKVGPRIRFFISGGAALSKDTADFFGALGLPIIEGYGLTETSPVISVNIPEENRTGTVGRPLPNVEVRIMEDGEVVVRGPNVMRGYWKLPKENARALKDGWFHTGDIGRVDDDGYVVITDRKKDIIITSVGKNVSPQGIETRLKSDEYIKEALVYGDGRAHLVALIVPDPERLEALIKKLKAEGGAGKMPLKDGPLAVFFAGRIAARLKGAARFEQIRRFALISDTLTQETGELTPTMKVRRELVGNRYSALIESLYE